jgi:nitrite reductase/ring-hydroxylating ferredoxin subunit
MRFLLNLFIQFLKAIRPQIVPPPGPIAVGRVSEFAAGTLTEVDINGTSVLVTRVGDKLCAIENRCAHLPVPLGSGRVEDGTVICPLHNSRYELCSGANLDWTPGVAGVRVPRWTQQMIALGQSPKGIRAYPVTVENDTVYVNVYVEGV